jgi:hypothetical protein
MADNEILLGILQAQLDMKGVLGELSSHYSDLATKVGQIEANISGCFATQREQGMSIALQAQKVGRVERSISDLYQQVENSSKKFDEESSITKIHIIKEEAEVKTKKAVWKNILAYVGWVLAVITAISGLIKDNKIEAQQKQLPTAQQAQRR